jgi:hypothetical protein
MIQLNFMAVRRLLPHLVADAERGKPHVLLNVFFQET